jgi:hypothetical protein
METAPDRTMIDPIEISKALLIINKVIPTAAMPLIDAFVTILMRLIGVKKSGAKNSMRRRINPMITKSLYCEISSNIFEFFDCIYASSEA